MKMWFKDTGRLAIAGARLNNAELGLLYRLILFAWERQGITEKDIPAFAHRMREPVENVQLAWIDFQSLATEKDAKWMTDEQWESVEEYKIRSGKGKKGNEVRWQRRITENKEVSDPLAIPQRSNGDPATILARSRIEENRKKEEKREQLPQGETSCTSSAGKPPRPSALDSLPEKKSRKRPEPITAEWLEEIQTRVAYKHLSVPAVCDKMQAWCEEKGETPSRLRLINWLNREKPSSNGRQPVERPDDMIRGEDGFLRSRGMIQ